MTRRRKIILIVTACVLAVLGGCLALGRIMVHGELAVLTALGLEHALSEYAGDNGGFLPPSFYALIEEGYVWQSPHFGWVALYRPDTTTTPAEQDWRGPIYRPDWFDVAWGCDPSSVRPSGTCIDPTTGQRRALIAPASEWWPPGATRLCEVESERLAKKMLEEGQRHATSQQKRRCQDEFSVPFRAPPIGG